MNSGNIDPLPVMPSRRVLCLLLLLLPFLLFWRVWAPAPEQRLVFAYGDFVEQNYLARRYVAQELRSGRVPLWDPYTFGGQPAAASSLFQVFYPVAAWQVLFPELPLLALELEAIFHLGLAGVFTFLFLQRLTGHTGAAFLGGLVFSWSGLLTSWPALQLFVLETMVWMPAGLWLLEEGLQRRALGWMALAVVAYALSIYAGHAQMVLYSAYLSGAYLIWRSWRLRLPWHFVVRAGLIVALGTLGLGALQWLPSVEQALGSQRAAWTYAELANGFRPEELLGILRPRDAAWSPLYVGVVPLGLVIAGIA
ncbi:MAG: hypothetical protein JXB35_16765, partial [Anaerolineae bacterium]|nr:hypothetical protein [Anaerolineae bacterium]